MSTEYGRLLLAKSSVVVVMGALGGVNWLRLRRSNQAGLPLTHRLRRLRRSDAMRALVRETRLSPDALMLPPLTAVR